MNLDFQVQNLLFSAEVIAPIFLIIALGYVLKKMSVIQDSFFKDLSSFVFKIAFPLHLGLNLYKVDLSEVFSWKLALYSCLATIAVMIIGMFIFQVFTKDKKKLFSLAQAAYRGNYIVFIWVVERISGADGFANAVMLTIFLTPLVNILAVILSGIYLESKPEGSRIISVFFKTIKTPMIIGVMTGLLLNIIGIQIRDIILTPVGDIGKCAMPLALITLGAQLAVPGLSQDRKLVAIGSIYRMVLVPILILGGAVLLGFKDSSLATLIAVGGSPVAIVSYVVSAESGGDSELAGKLIVTTSALAVFTLFILLFILRSYRLI
jgi:predicted permease